jgi:hypothetical protein
LDLEAEFLEWADVAVGDLDAVSLVEVASAELALLHAVTEHVVGGGEHGGGHGHDGLLRTSTTIEA